MAAILNNASMIGVCFTKAHEEMLQKRLEFLVWKHMQMPESPLFEPSLLTALGLSKKTKRAGAKAQAKPKAKRKLAKDTKDDDGNEGDEEEDDAEGDGEGSDEEEEPEEEDEDEEDDGEDDGNDSDEEARGLGFRVNGLGFRV